MACPRLLSDNDLCRFRTKPCRRSKQMGCDFGITRCQYSHNIYWPRRCPFYLSNESTIRYIPVLCPDIIIKEDESSISHCNRGGGCPFAHSYEEINYHPLMYKTKICEEFQRGDCNTYYCHLIHGLAERRESRVYILPYTQNIQVPNYPGVVIASKINKVLSINNKLNNNKSIMNDNNKINDDIDNNNNNNNSNNVILRRNQIENIINDNRWSERIFSQNNNCDDFWKNDEEINKDKNQEQIRNENIMNVFRAFVLDDNDIINDKEKIQLKKNSSNSSMIRMKNDKDKIIQNIENETEFSLIAHTESRNKENTNTNNFFD